MTYFTSTLSTKLRCLNLILMDNPNEIDMDISKNIDGIDPMTVELIRMSERIKIFSKLRNLIYEKQYEHDNDAADLLGWAYEKLAD